MNEIFCSVNEVRDFVVRTVGANSDTNYFETTLSYMLDRSPANKDNCTFTEEEMDLQGFLVFTNLLRNWYDFDHTHIANFINQKFKEKFSITKSDIIDVISKSLTEFSPSKTKTTKSKASKASKVSKVSKVSKSKGKTKEKPVNKNADMYKIVQDELKNGFSKIYVQKKYKLTQRELTIYEGKSNWSDSQIAAHKKMLEYIRKHPTCTPKEAIEKGCGDKPTGYRYALVPTKEEQEEYNLQFNKKAAPKAAIKLPDIKSLVLSDNEKKEQQALYDKIKEIASAREVSTKNITALFKARLTKDYGIVIDQIKKELMIKYNVNRGEGKAPNMLEAIVMSEYLPIAKSVLDDMLSESYAIK